MAKKSDHIAAQRRPAPQAHPAAAAAAAQIFTAIFERAKIGLETDFPAQIAPFRCTFAAVLAFLLNLKHFLTRTQTRQSFQNGLKTRLSTRIRWDFLQ